jgi:hypothetical protein
MQNATKFTPGPGTLTVNGNVTFNGGGTNTIWNINLSGLNPTNVNLLSLGGSSNLNLVTTSSSQITFDVTALSGVSPPAGTPLSYDIALVSTGVFQSNGVTITSGNSFPMSNFAIVGTNFALDPTSLSLSVSGNNLVLTFTPTPEPAGILLVAAGTAVILGLIRRRRHLALNNTSG